MCRHPQGISHNCSFRFTAPGEPGTPALSCLSLFFNSISECTGKTLPVELWIPHAWCPFRRQHSSRTDPRVGKKGFGPHTREKLLSSLCPLPYSLYTYIFRVTSWFLSCCPVPTAPNPTTPTPPPVNSAQPEWTLAAGSWPPEVTAWSSALAKTEARGLPASEASTLGAEKSTSVVNPWGLPEAVRPAQHTLHPPAM